jgi:hypothetical protein
MAEFSYDQDGSNTIIFILAYVAEARGLVNGFSVFST